MKTMVVQAVVTAVVTLLVVAAAKKLAPATFQPLLP